MSMFDNLTQLKTIYFTESYLLDRSLNCKVAGKDITSCKSRVEIGSKN